MKHTTFNILMLLAGLFMTSCATTGLSDVVRRTKDNSEMGYESSTIQRAASSKNCRIPIKGKISTRDKEGGSVSLTSVIDIDGTICYFDIFSYESGIMRGIMSDDRFMAYRSSPSYYAEVEGMKDNMYLEFVPGSDSHSKDSTGNPGTVYVCMQAAAGQAHNVRNISMSVDGKMRYGYVVFRMTPEGLRKLAIKTMQTLYFVTVPYDIVTLPVQFLYVIFTTR